MGWDSRVSRLKACRQGVTRRWWRSRSSAGRGGTALEVRQELRQIGVGGLEGSDAAQPQLAGEPILQRGPQPLDAAFGLRRLRGDESDAQVLERPAEVRGILLAPQLFLQCPVVIVALKDIEPIAVQRGGHAVRAADLAEDGEVAVKIFRGTKAQG